jgi:hypothetical protein
LWGVGGEMKRIYNAFKEVSQLAALCIVCSCHYDPSLTAQENWTIERMQQSGWGHEKKDVVDYLWSDNPERLAANSAKKGDYRLIGFVGRDTGVKTPHATNPFGVTCSAPVEILKENQGCVPGPPIYYKLILRYNAALIHQSTFPQKENCKMDQVAVDKIEKMGKDWDDSLKKDSEDKIKKWEEKNKKYKLYNGD